MMESATILGKLIRELIGYEGLEEEGIIDKWFSKKSVQMGVQKLEEEKRTLKEIINIKNNLLQILMIKY